MTSTQRHPAAHQHSGRPVPPAEHRVAAPAGGSITIDCSTCVMRATPTCHECVVTYLCDREADDAVVFDIVELRAVRLLADAGLLPSLQHREAESG